MPIVYKHLADIDIFRVNEFFPQREKDKPRPRVVLAMKLRAEEPRERKEDE